MDSVLVDLKKRYKSISFEPGDTFSWSSKNQTIIFKPAKKDSPQSIWALIHEVAHAALEHKNYEYDFDLLKMETEAWNKASEIAKDLGIDIDEDHIQDCLDTYRDWLHQRATCPRCGVVCLQPQPQNYNCHNCNANWSVSDSRFCRPYRKIIN